MADVEPPLPESWPWDPSLPLRTVSGPYGRTAYAASGVGHPIVFLHDFGASAIVWAQALRDLSDLGSLYAVDLIGHGFSSAPSVEYTPQLFLAWLGDFLAGLDIADATIVGSGLSGAAAMVLAALHPQRVRRLVLLGPSIPGVQPSGRAMYWLFWLAHQQGAQRRLFEMLLPHLLRWAAHEAAGNVESLAPMLASARSALQRPAVRSAQRSMIRHWHEWLACRPKLGQLTLPVLLLWGRDDRLYPLRHARLLQTSMPQTQMVVIDACGHLPHLERPAAVASAVRSFLATGSTGNSF